MSDDKQMLEKVLRECRVKAPSPFYPAVDGKDKFERVSLDAALDQLRMGGLIELTPWQPGHGQGYTLTSAGEETLQSPRLLSRLQTHGVEAKREEERPAPASTNRPMNPWERGEAVRAILMGARRPTVTIALISICVGVFFLGMTLAGQKGVPSNVFLEGKGLAVAEVLRETGAINRPMVILQDEWWRLLSHQFVHIGIIHLLLNMFFLYNVGQIVEVMWGHFRFLILFLISGIGGGCVVVLQQNVGFTAGASGALCGIFASLGVWIMWNRRYLPAQVVSSSMRNLMLNAVIIAVISTMSNVSWQAHLGGAVAGAVVSVPLMYTRFGISWQRWLGWLGVLVVPVACVLIIIYSGSAEDRLAITLDSLAPTEHDAGEIYNTVTVPLLNEPRKLLDDDKRKAEAKNAIVKATKKLERAASELAMIQPSTKTNESEVEAAKEYVAGWQALLGATEKFLDSGRNLREHRDELLEQSQRLLSNELFKKHFKAK